MIDVIMKDIMIDDTYEGEIRLLSVRDEHDPEF